MIIWRHFIYHTLFIVMWEKRIIFCDGFAQSIARKLLDTRTQQWGEYYSSLLGSSQHVNEFAQSIARKLLDKHPAIHARNNGMNVIARL
jgi:hypothetical protein